MPEVKYPVLADTGHILSRAYGVLLEETGAALRGALQTGELCPIEWKPGTKTLGKA